MDAFMLFIWFFLGMVIGYVISRNFVFSLIFGGLFFLVAVGVVTVGFDFMKLVPKLW